MQPISLYIHIPWCIRKCPYCDFNSHKSLGDLPEKNYIDALIMDLKQDIGIYGKRPLRSIFIGGGTPSLFSAQSFENLLNKIEQLLPFSMDIEITLEANPGTFEQQRFIEYRQVGINRLSLGIQSFNKQHLKSLGRIHDDKQAYKAIDAARNAGFDNLNLDIMYALPKQSISEGLADLAIAISLRPQHLSWYQLTIEPNTVFYKQKPRLPSEDCAYYLEEKGLAQLEKNGLKRYEISAFAKEESQAYHNLNYWLFGDFFGIGAGAHGKHTSTKGVVRSRKFKQPKDYLDLSKAFVAGIDEIYSQDLVFEFMLNTSRLEQEIPLQLFTEKTGLDLSSLLPKLRLAESKNLIRLSEDSWQVTPLGRRFTNNLQEIFLP